MSPNTVCYEGCHRIYCSLTYVSYLHVFSHAVLYRYLAKDRYLGLWWSMMLNKADNIMAKLTLG